ncbi:MAG: MFS transporter [Gammaproteobacteria bacterium]|nr:MFS transporter [Gammaproteobacteria bacterium]
MSQGLGQFELLATKRLAPLFTTQFFGALNDNLFRSAMGVIIVYGGLIASEDTNFFVNAAAALFMLPFFLFSATAGRLADKYEKAKLVRMIKVAEIIVAALAGLALFTQSVPMMLTVLFLLGTQSAFFGPLKYSILPQHLHESELVGGNAMVAMGTFVAILLGTLIGTAVGGGRFDSAYGVLFAMILAAAFVGYVASRRIPAAEPTGTVTGTMLNPVKDTLEIIRLAAARKPIFLSILGVSWFWLLGGLYIAQIPNLTKVHLYGDQTVVTLLLGFFTLSIAAGSLLCEWLSGRKIEIGLVPFGALGLSIAGIDVYFAINALEPVATRGAMDFLAADGTPRLLVDIFLLGVFAAFYEVPLYASIQARTPEATRARVIAATNIINSFFMVTGSLCAILWLSVLGLSIPSLLLSLAIGTLLVAGFIFGQVPEFAMRFLIWTLTHTMYRVTHESLDRIPEKGAALLVCNHVSYVDALIIGGSVPRPVRFIMLGRIFDIPVLNFVFRTGRAIPIESPRVNNDVYERALEEIREGLESGDLLCIFPEGKLTTDGRVDTFKRGVEGILASTPVPTVPLALQGLWGSFFSHKGGTFKNTGRIWSRVKIVAGEALDPEGLSAETLRAHVARLRGDHA